MDLTLYHSDIDILIQLVTEKYNDIHKRATRCMLPDDDYETMQRLDSLRDKLNMRLSQLLHPIN